MAHEYRFSGRLCGLICKDCREALSNVEVRLYRTRSDQRVTELVAASSKTTFSVLSDEEVSAKEDSLLGAFQTDADGAFTADLGIEQGYDGEAFEIDVYCATVPGRPHSGRAPKPVQFSITVLQPIWREGDAGASAYWEYCLPYRFWCKIRSLFGAWTICGHLTTCDSDSPQPVPGMRVSAFDADWLQHDALGSAITDGSGHFRINYLAPDFEKTIFSWLNIELVGGPDLYFRVETLGGDILIDEPSTRGRAPDRENVGPCFCVDLCVKEAPVVDHAWFTRVGDFDITSDFSAAGTTTGARPIGPTGHGGPGFAFFGAIKLIGDCPTHYPGGGAPMRYRFLVGPVGATPTPLLSADIMSRAVGDRPILWRDATGLKVMSQQIIVAPSVFAGAMPAGAPQPPPPAVAGVSIPPAVLVPDGNGWVTVDPAANLGGFSGPLMHFMTATRVPGGPAPGSGAGNAPASPKAGTHVQIVFQAEPVTGPTPAAPTLTNSLPNIYINNWEAVAELGLQEFGAGCCTPLSTSLTIKYTADHEFMRSWGVGLSSCALPGGPPAGVTLPSGTTPRGGFGSDPINISNPTAWPACSYIVSLTTTRALTDGESDAHPKGPQLPFCIDRP
jgi:hypothetical protein